MRISYLKMNFVVLVIACLLCREGTFAAQILEYSTFHVGGTVLFNIKIKPSTDTVTAAGISDLTTGEISTGAATNACSYDETTSPVSLTKKTNSFNEEFYEFEVLIDYQDINAPKFKTADGQTDLGCYFQAVDAATGKFKFYVRGLASLGGSQGTDREYEIDSTGTDISNAFETGSTSFQSNSVSVTAATSTTYTFAMTVVDSPGQTDQTSMDLGETAQLKFTMTIDPYEDKMDLAGARLTNCVVSKMSDFSIPAVTFIGANGCFLDVGIFDNVNTDVGFNRHSSSGKSGTTKTYTAFSPKFEMSAFTRNPVNAANQLYFKCDVTFCLDDSNSAAVGDCGSSHCDPSRKRRDVHEKPTMSVTASVNITSNRHTRKRCNNCTDSKIFQASVGGLATAVAIAFGVMTISFAGAKTAAVARSRRRRQTGPKSSVSLATESTTGSDVRKNGHV